MILEYLNSGLLLSSIRRVTQGTQEVVRRLSQNAHQVRLRSSVIEDSRTDEGTATFDHVELATQATQLLKNASPEEREVLASFSYEPSRVVVHTDTRLAHLVLWVLWVPPHSVARECGQVSDVDC